MRNRELKSLLARSGIGGRMEHGVDPDRQWQLGIATVEAEENTNQEGERKRRAERDIPTNPQTTTLIRSKRERKSDFRLVPEDYTDKSTNVPVIDGRGFQLREIGACRRSIQSHNLSSPEIDVAFHFLFAVRGRVSNRSKVEHLLRFNGYLKNITDDPEEEKKRRGIDESEEVRMSKRAYKLRLDELRKLCDFFQVDQRPEEGERASKDFLVDRLLDFLGAPDPQLTVNTIGRSVKVKKKAKGSFGSPKKKPSAIKWAKPAKPSPKKIYTSEDDDDETESNDDDGDDSGSDDDPPLITLKHEYKKNGHKKDDETSGNGEEGGTAEGAEKGKLPSDEKLREWVKFYVGCFNLDIVTPRHAIATASSKFGVDLSTKKKRIKEMLTEEI